MKDWQVRASKTFVQAFLGVLIPEVCYFLGDLSQIESIGSLPAIMLPVVSSALAAGISAAWNIIREKLEEDGKRQAVYDLGADNERGHIDEDPS